MKFKVTKSIVGPKHLGAEIERRTRAAVSVAAGVIAQNLQEAVQERIPDLGVWTTLYKSAIQYRATPDGRQLAVAGLSEVALTTVPAASTQLAIRGNHPVSVVLARYNPWTVDTLPALAGGIPGEAEVRPASAQEVATHRQRLAAVLPEVLAELKAAGATEMPGGFPQVSGKVFLDLPFLQARLEHGLGDFPRVAHWLPAAQQSRNDADRWVREADGEIRGALAGETPTPLPTMDPGLAKKLTQRRRSTWP